MKMSKKLADPTIHFGFAEDGKFLANAGNSYWEPSNGSKTLVGSDTIIEWRSGERFSPALLNNSNNRQVSKGADKKERHERPPRDRRFLAYRPEPFSDESQSLATSTGSLARRVPATNSSRSCFAQVSGI